MNDFFDDLDDLDENMWVFLEFMAFETSWLGHST